MKQDYREYHFSGKEIAKYLVQSILLCGALDYLFYQSKWLMILAIPATVVFLKMRKRQLIRERKKNLNYQFKDALNALSVAVQAGYSVENAVSACAGDLERIYPQDADIVKGKEYYTTSDEQSYSKVESPVKESLSTYYEKAPGSHKINVLIACGQTCKTVPKINSIYYFAPGTHTKGDGYLYQNRSFSDVFVFPNGRDGKIDSVYADVDTEEYTATEE